ncbi:hypothetical protein KIPB_005235 [Kipferlia bialata]|uniref:Uncharacterized protein n=1 Tax=Kipferlia bialata TaxID=797122 RepID=A0A9K3CX66_9EUKA|nr:hypothetical protein KIPB_005235 [Kipferlia bialata]|eukprot:g5235.t1
MTFPQSTDVPLFTDERCQDNSHEYDMFAKCHPAVPYPLGDGLFITLQMVRINVCLRLYSYATDRDGNPTLHQTDITPPREWPNEGPFPRAWEHRFNPATDVSFTKVGDTVVMIIRDERRYARSVPIHVLSLATLEWDTVSQPDPPMCNYILAPIVVSLGDRMVVCQGKVTQIYNPDTDTWTVHHDEGAPTVWHGYYHAAVVADTLHIIPTGHTGVHSTYQLDTGWTEGERDWRMGAGGGDGNGPGEDLDRLAYTDTTSLVFGSVIMLLSKVTMNKRMREEWSTHTEDRCPSVEGQECLVVDVFDTLSGQHSTRISRMWRHYHPINVFFQPASNCVLALCDYINWKYLGFSALYLQRPLDYPSTCPDGTLAWADVMGDHDPGCLTRLADHFQSELWGAEERKYRMQAAMQQERERARRMHYQLQRQLEGTQDLEERERLRREMAEMAEVWTLATMY